MKERIYYLDIAKAIVIVGTILLHIGAFHTLFCGGDGFWVFKYIAGIVGLLHCPYSMPAFFIMRGYYNKERSLADEIKGNCKRLIVPMFLLYYLPNPQWFCYAMFFSLLFYNLIHRLSNKCDSDKCFFIRSITSVCFARNHQRCLCPNLERTLVVLSMGNLRHKCPLLGGTPHQTESDSGVHRSQFDGVLFVPFQHVALAGVSYSSIHQ